MYLQKFYLLKLHDERLWINQGRTKYFSSIKYGENSCVSVFLFTFHQSWESRQTFVASLHWFSLCS